MISKFPYITKTYMKTEYFFSYHLLYVMFGQAIFYY